MSNDLREDNKAFQDDDASNDEGDNIKNDVDGGDDNNIHSHKDVNPLEEDMMGSTDDQHTSAEVYTEDGKEASPCESNFKMDDSLDHVYSYNCPLCKTLDAHFDACTNMVATKVGINTIHDHSYDLSNFSIGVHHDESFASIMESFSYIS